MENGELKYEIKYEHGDTEFFVSQFSILHSQFSIRKTMRAEEAFTRVRPPLIEPNPF